MDSLTPTCLFLVKLTGQKPLSIAKQKEQYWQSQEHEQKYASLLTLVQISEIHIS